VNDFFPADYVIGIATLAAGVLGIFGGFSGALAFGAGLVSAGVGGKFAHRLLVDFFSAEWAVLLATLIVALLAFGLARLVVKRVVKGLLAQPADAIFGSLVAALTGAALSILVIYAANRLLNAGIASVVGERVFEFLPWAWSAS